MHICISIPIDLYPYLNGQVSARVGKGVSQTFVNSRGPPRFLYCIPMSEPVQLPPIGGGAPSAASSVAATGDARHVNDVRHADSLKCQHSTRIASHQGVLENTRGRGERRERQERESTRERSRRIERPTRPDIREARESRGSLEGELKKPKLEHDSDLPKHAHPRDEDELLDAKGPPVFDLTQRDEDDDGSGALSPDDDARWNASNLQKEKRIDFPLADGPPNGEGIIAPTPHLGPAPSTPLTLVGQHQSLAPPWISDLLDSMATLHQKQDRTHVDVLDFGNEIKNQALRLDTLEIGMRDHTQLHEATKARIDELEKQVSVLQQRQASRSPTPTRGPATPRRQSTSHPRSPRSPHFARDEQSETDDLQVVVGGWTDARKSEAFEEVKLCCPTLGTPTAGPIYGPLRHAQTLCALHFHSQMRVHIFHSCARTRTPSLQPLSQNHSEVALRDSRAASCGQLRTRTRRREREYARVDQSVL